MLVSARTPSEGETGTIAGTVGAVGGGRGPHEYFTPLCNHLEPRRARRPHDDAHHVDDHAASAANTKPPVSQLTPATTATSPSCNSRRAGRQAVRRGVSGEITSGGLIDRIAALDVLELKGHAAHYCSPWHRDANVT